MRTSDTCRPRNSRAFTLVELLVVLAVAGLLTAIALPSLAKLAQRVEASAQRKGVLREIEGLGFRAYSEGRAIRLTSSAADAPPVVALPPGWKLTVARPIEYQFNGVCGGGQLDLAGPDAVVERFRLAAPVCRLEPVS
jgi:prepilin-type N-terminal cleavage/methylation domain-containing protein